MKIIYEFDMPEEKDDYELFHNVPKIRSFLLDFSQQLRCWHKYGNDFKDADDALNRIRDEFYRLINEHNIDMDL